MFSFSTFYNVYLPFRYNNAPSICTLLYLPGTVSASPSLCLPLQSSVHPARLRNETLRVGVHMGSRFLFTVEFPGQGEWWWEVTDWAQWSRMKFGPARVWMVHLLSGILYPHSSRPSIPPQSIRAVRTEDLYLLSAVWLGSSVPVPETTHVQTSKNILSVVFSGSISPLCFCPPSTRLSLSRI